MNIYTLKIAYFLRSDSGNESDNNLKILFQSDTLYFHLDFISHTIHTSILLTSISTLDKNVCSIRSIDFLETYVSFQISHFRYNYVFGFTDVQG
jgi:hypothetical protein